MTHPDLPISFPSREILRSSLLSSLWSEAAIAKDCSKRVRSTLLEIVLSNRTLHLCPTSVTHILFSVFKCQQFNNDNPSRSDQGSNNQMLLVWTNARKEYVSSHDLLFSRSKLVSWLPDFYGLLWNNTRACETTSVWFFFSFFYQTLYKTVNAPFQELFLQYWCSVMSYTHHISNIWPGFSS